MRYQDAFFDRRQAAARAAAREIVPLVLDLVRPRSVVDFGCARGEWLSIFREHGIEDVLGIDRLPCDERRLLIPAERFSNQDLLAGARLARRFDLALALEVAEHLPESSAAGFVASLVAAAPVVLFSAAIPHQGGTGHVHERWQDYWAARFEAHDYRALDPLRRRLWGNPGVPRWYRQNLLLYTSDAELSRNPELAREHGRTDRAQLNLVHPETYLRAARPPTRRILHLLGRQLLADLCRGARRVVGRRAP
jgi:hypothetical protein